MSNICLAMGFAFLLAIATGCNPEQAPPAQQADTVLANSATPLQADTLGQADPLVLADYRDKKQEYFDSMMNQEVTLPPILDERAYDTATVNSFSRLAAQTKGEMKLLASAQLLQQNISDIICKNSQDYADILFLVDNSGSMDDDIVEVQKGIRQIIDVLKDRRKVRLAIAIYRDKEFNRDNWFDFREFGTDLTAAEGYVDSMQLIGNNDLPESVYEAFIEASKHRFWRSPTKRIVLIVGDARPKEKSEGGQYTMDDMLRQAAESRIKVNFFPLIVTPYSEQYRVADKSPQPATETGLIESMYPNPVSRSLRIKLLNPGRHRLIVYTMTGMLIDEMFTDDPEWMLDFGNRPSGLYVLRVLNESNQFEQRKFVVQH